MTIWDDDREPTPPVTVYAGVADFVRDWLAPTYRRPVDGGHFVWCQDWQLHPEAVSRLTAMWTAWEAQNTADKPAGLSAWWLGVCDPQMAVLLSPDGPFRQCRHGHRDMPPLPLDPGF